jgi:hypothetical protein
VKDKFERHRASIEMLSKGLAEMQKSLPSSGGVKGSPTVSKLKALMEDVETVKAERCQLVFLLLWAATLAGSVRPLVWAPDRQASDISLRLGFQASHRVGAEGR